MKKLVTILLFVGTCSTQVFGQSHTVALRPSHDLLPASQGVFLNAPHYTAPFTANQVQALYDSLSYIDTVTNVPLTRYGVIPSQLNFIQSDQSLFTDTLTYYGEHFSPTFTAYLDAVQLVMAIPPNGLIQSGNDSLNAHAMAIRIKTSSTPASKAIDTTYLTYDDLSVLPQDGSFFYFTVPMHHKRVGKSFYVEIAPAIDPDNGLDPAFQSFFAISEDSTWIGMLSDNPPLPAAARSYVASKHGGSPTGTATAISPLALVDQQQNEFYDNFFIVAYITDVANGVGDHQLSGNELAQNYPNPFNPSTEIGFSLSEHSYTTLKVYNALGREVASLVDGNLEAGLHSVNFLGDNLPSGTYYYTLKAGTFTQTKRMVLAK